MLKLALPLSVSALFLMNSAMAATPAVVKKTTKETVKTAVVKKPTTTKKPVAKKVTTPKKKLVEKNKATNEEGKFALTGKVGTLGLGFDVTYDINEKLNTRFNLNGASFDYDDEDEGVNYKGNLKGLTIGGLLDYHPTGGGFRLTAGIYNNSNEFDLDAEGDNDEAEIGDGVYDLTGANLNSNVSFKSMAPYLGLGYGNAVKKGTGKWGFSLDAGVLFQGAPEGKLTASGTGREVTTNAEIDLANDPVFQAELAKEQEDLNKEMEDFEMFPVISIGASYRF